MNGPATERWKELCKQASSEQDPQKVGQLVTENMSANMERILQSR
jgi:hypothetical protein